MPETNNDDEIQSYMTNGKHGPFEMDAAFCARMHAAIAAGLESAPTSVSTAPGTKKPKYYRT
jgi:hypothetical protein